MTIAEALGIPADRERVWREGDLQYVYTPERPESCTVETLTRQRVIAESGAGPGGNYMRMGRLVYLTAGAARNRRPA